MDPPPPPPSSATMTSDPLPTIPSDTSKIRLMCSYGGHIVPRPQSKSLVYAGGDTRIIALDRRTTASSFSALTAHLSKTLFNNRPFHLKYQLPNEDLDSLISVTTDEDLQNLLEEHDLNSKSKVPTSSRIRLFLFPVKPESLGSVLLDRKSESWFSDALKNTRIIQRGQSTETGLRTELLGLDSVGGPDFNGNVAAQGGGLSSGGGGGDVGDVKETGGVPESLILETSSSFGSTNSSVSMANLPAIGLQSEDCGMGLLEKKIRVASSASIESDTSVGSGTFQSKKGSHQEPLIQVASGGPSCSSEVGKPIFDPISTDNPQKPVQISGYYQSPQLVGNHHPYELPYNQVGVQYMSPYGMGPTPLASYYQMYPMPMQPAQAQAQAQAQGPYLVNQPYPIYLVPVRPNQNYNISHMESNSTDNANISGTRPPLHPQSAFISSSVAYKEVSGSQALPELMSMTYPAVSSTPPVVAPPTQAKMQNTDPTDPPHPSQTVGPPNRVSELDDDLAYTQIYKSQPPAPELAPQYQTLMKGMTVLLSESSTKQQTTAQHQTSMHPQ